MSISMIGLDHTQASVDIQPNLHLLKRNAGAALERLKECEDIRGCILLSTRNRMELWVSTDEDCEICLYDLLLQDFRDFRRLLEHLFVKRRDQEAVEHLFYLTSGLKSQILGEDQILTQVKDAPESGKRTFCYRQRP